MFRIARPEIMVMNGKPGNPTWAFSGAAHSKGT
jgi:hypothetical protein